MSSPNSTSVAPPLDLSSWRHAPNLLIGVGAILAGVGAYTNYKQFAFSWLLAFMFFLSLALGALFLVLMHHLFDAGWSVPIRRFLEHIACLAFPWMAILFLPILLNVIFAGPDKILYPWMASDAHTDHALHAKQPMFTKTGFYGIAAFCFGAWWWFSNRLRHWSLAQDKAETARCAQRPGGLAWALGLNMKNAGIVDCTLQLRKFSAVGVFFFAITLTLGAIMWMKALQHQWFSTMYGVYYFAGSVWLTVATAYLITMVLEKRGTITAVMHEHQFYFLGSLLFAFTVFYAYIHFSQYFIIWNANMPEETFWYLQREKGTWWDLGMIIIFGHFFVPFLALLRIDAKVSFACMMPVCVWAWLMHWCDLSFNIMPVLHPDGFVLHFADLGCLALIGGVLARAFLKNFAAHPPYPLKDPRLNEAAGHRHPVATQISGGELDETDAFVDGEAGNPKTADEPT